MPADHPETPTSSINTHQHDTDSETQQNRNNTVHSSEMESAQDCSKSFLGFIVQINRFIRKTRL